MNISIQTRTRENPFVTTRRRARRGHMTVGRNADVVGPQGIRRMSLTVVSAAWSLWSLQLLQTGHATGMRSGRVSGADRRQRRAEVRGP